MKWILIAILMIMGISLAYDVGRRSTAPGTSYIDTLRVTVVDTITERVPVAVDSAVVRYITKDISVRDTLYDVRVRDSVVLITLPIEQRHYASESYDAWVSGYDAALDSIKVYNRTQMEVIRQKPRRWGIGISAGAGMTSEGIRPYVGIGITYTLF